MLMTNIYILKLTGGKYYVGKSDAPEQRIREHQAGNGSAWTKRYKVVSVEKIVRDASDFDEDKYTKEYMSKYGIDNVRGGSYSTLTLDEVQESALDMELNGAKNKCFRCGRAGHFVSQCYANIEEESSEDEEDRCFRCGRPGHYVADCYASRHIFGYSLR